MDGVGHQGLRESRMAAPGQNQAVRPSLWELDKATKSRRMADPSATSQKCQNLPCTSGPTTLSVIPNSKRIQRSARNSMSTSTRSLSGRTSGMGQRHQSCDVRSMSGLPPLGRPCTSSPQVRVPRSGLQQFRSSDSTQPRDMRERRSVPGLPVIAPMAFWRMPIPFHPTASRRCWSAFRRRCGRSGRGLFPATRWRTLRPGPGYPHSM